MNLSKIIPVVLGVLKNPYVICAAVAVILYCNFVSYVARYRKKPPKPKKKISSPAPAPAPAQPAEEGADDDSAPDAE